MDSGSKLLQAVLSAVGVMVYLLNGGVRKKHARSSTTAST